MLKIKKAFTLAEMMVVMLIMSIILAAMAPVMTTRSKADSSSPWRFSPGHLNDAYFGIGGSQIALIGMPTVAEDGSDEADRLIINTASDGNCKNHIAFKHDSVTLGRLAFKESNLLLGSGVNFANLTGNNNISIGLDNLTQLTSGSSNIAIGDNALTSNSSGSNNVGIGTTLSSNIEGSNNVAVGDNALASANERWNVAVGSNAYQNGTGGSNTIIGGDSMSQGSGNNNVAVGTEALRAASGDGNIAIGARANSGANELTNTIAIGFSNSATGYHAISIGDGAASGEASVAIGNASSSGQASIAISPNTLQSPQPETQATGFTSIAIGGNAQSGDSSVSIGGDSEGRTNAVAVGSGARAEADDTVAVGFQAISNNDNAIALGNNSRASDNDAIAIGNSVTASGESSIAIGSNEGTHTTQALADKALAIGDGAYATGENSIALGPLAEARGLNNIAIGTQACEGVTGSNKICIGHHSGPQSNHSWATDSVERIFIGGKSNFNNGPAVLEVHNSNGFATNVLATGSGKGDSRYNISQTGVVVNGNLFVKGMIFFNDGSDDWNGPSIIKYNGKNDGYGAQAYGREIVEKTDQIYYSDTAGKLLHQRTDSDRRLKYVGKENTSSLDKIRQLKIFNYTLKKDPLKEPHVGVIAQDLQKVFPDAVKKGTDGFLSIRFEDMFFAMINAIKELDLKYQAQEKRIDELEKRIEKLESKIK